MDREMELCVGTIRRAVTVNMADGKRIPTYLMTTPRQAAYAQDLEHATEVLDKNQRWIPLPAVLKGPCADASFGLRMREGFVNIFNTVFR